MEEKKTTFKLIGRFLEFLKPYWKKGAVAFFFMLLAVSLQLPMPFLTKYLIDNVIGLKSFKILNVIGLVLAGILVVRALSSFIESFCLIVFKSRVLFDVRIKLFEHVQKLSLSFFHKKETGYLMSRVSGDVDAVEGLLAGPLLLFGQSVMTFIAGVGCTLYIHRKLALICFGILSLYLFSLQVFNRRIRNMSYELREKYAKVNKDLQELLSAASLVKAFTGEKRVTIKQVQSLKNAVRKEVKLEIFATVASISSVVISGTGPIVLIWYGCAEIMRGNLSIGGLIAFNSFVGYLFGPAKNLFDLNIIVQRSLAACKRVFEILDVDTEREGRNNIRVRDGKVSFENVSFGYEGKDAVFENLSFTANPNEIVAVVGKSGAGKTTLLSLIPRFYELKSGRITIDGEDIKDAKLKNLRKQIGIVAQDTFLFSDTITENIRFGNPDAKEEDVRKAARLANCEEFIKEMPDGYDSKIGERGVTLSGGQRQRISIARAVLRDPKILILDEATSSLDSESERIIQEALAPLMKGRTTFIIAHRLSTVRNADKIIVLQDRRIAGIGKHIELYEKCNAYRQLYDEQFMGKSEPVEA